MSSQELVVVTGAAVGIGRATCEALLEAGYSVLGIDINRSVVRQIEDDGYRGILADTCDEAEMERALGSAWAPVRHVVTCAGIALPEESQDDAGRGLPSPEVFRRSRAPSRNGSTCRAASIAWRSPSRWAGWAPHATSPQPCSLSPVTCDMSAATPLLSMEDSHWAADCDMGLLLLGGSDS